MAMRNTEMEDVFFDQCFITDFVFLPKYVIFLTTLLLFFLTSTIVCYVLTLILLKKATTRNAAAQFAVSTVEVNPAPSSHRAEGKRLKTQRQHLRVIISIILLIGLSWGLMAIILYVYSFCQICIVALPVVKYIIQILLIIPLFGNGIIYFVKIPQFRTVFRQLFCCGVRGQTDRVYPSTTTTEG
jgi:hypothetical protein